MKFVNIIFSIITFFCFISESKADKTQKIQKIPAGVFSMGTKTNLLTKARTEEATPRHKVILNAFLIDKYETTQKEYEQLMHKNPVATKDNLADTQKLKNKEKLNRPVEIVGDNYPITNVNWYDSAAYCNARSKKEGLEPCYDEETWKCDFSKNGYRLPTEAEWEYACRAGNDTKYYFGDDESQLIEYANYWPNRQEWDDALLKASLSNPPKLFRWEKPLPTLLPVGSKKPNKWELYDMLGNAYEWCNDWYDGDYYSKSPLKNPKGSEKSKSKAVRGGSFLQSTLSCSERSSISPNKGIAGIGFRCVRNAPKEEKTEEKPVKPEEPQPENKK